MAGNSRLSKAMKYYRDLGYKVAKVETWNIYDKKNHDLFGILDLIAVGNREVLGIQVCGGGDFAAHDRKLMASEVSPLWTEAARLILIGFRKVKYKRGGKLMVWKPRIKEYCLADFPDRDELKPGKSQQRATR